MNNPILMIDPTGMAADSIPTARTMITAVYDVGKNGFSDAGKLISSAADKVVAKIDNLIRDTDHSAVNPEGQQHSGDNKVIYYEGSQHGFEMRGDIPDPNGANETVDISSGLPSGGLRSSNMKKAGLGLPNSLLTSGEKIKSAVDRLQGTGFGRMKVCTGCGATLELNAPKSWHPGFDTIRTNKQ